MAAHVPAAAAAARDGDASSPSSSVHVQRGPHAVLSRPALLSHVFKFAVRKHKDVMLLHVSAAWEDTAVHYSAWLWERLIRAMSMSDAPPLDQPSSIEQHSQHAFEHYLCRAWLHVSYSPLLLTRLSVDVVLSRHALATITLAQLSELSFVDKAICFSHQEFLGFIPIKNSWDLFPSRIPGVYSHQEFLGRHALSI
jgi:hypothetical protein